MNKPIDAKHNGIGGYTVTFENRSTIKHVIARSPHEALEMVKLTPEYYYISNMKKTKTKSSYNEDIANEKSLQMENQMYMRGIRGLDY